jgi:hypothetical protein
MRLQDILKENNAAAFTSNTAQTASPSGTTSASIAKYDKIVDDDPVKRLADKKNKVSFMKYSTTKKECPGCNIIKTHGWDEVNQATSKATELTCQMCGKLHKKGDK